MFSNRKKNRKKGKRNMKELASRKEDLPSEKAI